MFGNNHLGKTVFINIYLLICTTYMWGCKSISLWVADPSDIPEGILEFFDELFV